MRVLVVGAGPTGLVTALELRRLGVEADIVDKRSSASGFSRAVGILPRSMELLNPSGAAQKLLDEAVTIAKARFLWEGSELATVPVEPQKGDARTITALPQDRTEAILAERLQVHGGRVAYETGLTGLKQITDGVEVTLGEEENRKYDLVVAADGVRSTVREILELPFPGFDLPETWSIADVELESWSYPATFTIGLWQEGSVMVIAPLGERRIRVIANDEQALSVVPFPLEIKNIRREGQFRISVRCMDSFRHDRVLFAGDAAHTHSPVGGRGMNLGIADGAQIAKLISGGNWQAYGPERREAAQYAIRVTERGRKFLMGNGPTNRFLVRAAISTMAALPPLKRYFVSNFLLE